MSENLVRRTQVRRKTARRGPGTSLAAISMAALLATALLAGGCTKGNGEGNGAKTGKAGESKAADTGRIHLEARFGDAGAGGGPFGEASWKVKPAEKQFKVQVERVATGTVLAVTLEGVEVGRITVDTEGEGELEFQDTFPEGFVEPSEGARVAVGDLADVTLGTVERVASLEVKLSGAMSGEVKYKAERIGGRIIREFEVDVARGGVEGEHEVTLDGVPVGILEIDDDGEGDFKYADASLEPFPPGFPEPKSGSVVRIGTAVEVKLEAE